MKKKVKNIILAVIAIMSLLIAGEYDGWWTGLLCILGGGCVGYLSIEASKKY